MADGDGAIRAAVSEVFPDALMAMCWFHRKHASKRHMGKYSACSHFTLFALFFVCLRKVEKSIPTHLQGDIGRPRTIPKLRNRSRNVQRHLGSAGEEVRRRIWLSFWGGEESHAWFPHPLFQEDVRDFKDAKWLLAGFHPTSTSDKQPYGKVRVSYSHYFCNYILIRTILVITSLFALFCYWKGNNFLFALFRVNQHFKKSYTEYKRLNIVQSSKKLCDFLKEYDLDYRKEKEPTVGSFWRRRRRTSTNISMCSPRRTWQSRSQSKLNFIFCIRTILVLIRTLFFWKFPLNRTLFLLLIRTIFAIVAIIWCRKVFNILFLNR